MDPQPQTPLTFYQRYRDTIKNWKKVNREKHNQINAVYRSKEENREKNKIYQAEYRARKKAERLAVV